MNVSRADFERTLRQWETLTGPRGEANRLPYGALPDARLYLPPDADGQPYVTRTRWAGNLWNPPGHSLARRPHQDPAGAAKPAWETLMVILLALRRPEVIEAFRTWTRDQISRRAFKAHDVLDEALDAAADRHTPTQQARRDQVVTAYRAARERLQNATDIPTLESSHADGMAKITALLDSFDDAD